MLSCVSTKAQYRFGLLFSPLVDLLFPAACSSCGRVDTGWCLYCQHELETVPVTAYARTASLIATGQHTGILQHAVHGLKYDHLLHLALPLAERMAQLFYTLPWTIDGVVAVPSHSQRLKQRGYNQALLLAEAFSARTSIPYIPQALIRIRDTRTQVGLNHKERRINVADAFYADASQVNGKNVLVMDDVLTTGATFESCAEALQRAGAAHVYGLTVTTASI